MLIHTSPDGGPFRAYVASIIRQDDNPRHLTEVQRGGGAGIFPI